MRLGPMTVFMFVMYIFVGIFDQLFDKSLNAYGNGSSNFLFTTIIQPWNWSGSIDVSSFLGIFGITTIPTFYGVLGVAISAAIGIAVLGSVLGRSDISALFLLFSAFTAIGGMPCLVLYNFVTRNVAMYTDCVVGQPCVPAMILGAFTAGVLGLMWLFTCMEWWAWRATTQ